MIFLGTNICIHFLNGEHTSIRQNILATPPHRIKIPVIVESDIMYGVSKSRKKEENRAKLEAFLSAFEIIGYDTELPPPDMRKFEQIVNSAGCLLALWTC